MGAGKKLHSRSGASLLFAILVFMLCILAGTAALTAAAANSGRYSHLVDEQQKYLSVSSAVRVMKDEITGMTFTATVDATETKITTGATPSATTTTTKYDASSGSITSSDVGKVFEDYFNSIVSNKYDSSKALSVAVDETFTISGVDDMKDVTVNVKADERYNITMTFSVGDEYKTVVTFPAMAAYSSGERLAGDPVTDASGNTTVETNWTETAEVKWLEENVTVTGGGVK